MNEISQNIGLYDGVFNGSKHRAKIIQIGNDSISIKLVDNDLCGTIKFSHLKFPEVWLSSLLYRKINTIIPIKIMHISSEMEIFAVPTDLLTSLTQINEISISDTELEKRLESSISHIKSQMTTLTNEVETLTQNSIAIFRGIKELGNSCSKKTISLLRQERSEILRQRKNKNESLFDLLINLRVNEEILASLKNELNKNHTKNINLQHI